MCRREPSPTRRKGETEQERRCGQRQAPAAPAELGPVPRSGGATDAPGAAPQPRWFLTGPGLQSGSSRRVSATLCWQRHRALGKNPLVQQGRQAKGTRGHPWAKLRRAPRRRGFPPGACRSRCPREGTASVWGAQAAAVSGSLLVSLTPKSLTKPLQAKPDPGCHPPAAPCQLCPQHRQARAGANQGVTSGSRTLPRVPDTRTGARPRTSLEVMKVCKVRQKPQRRFYRATSDGTARLPSAQGRASGAAGSKGRSKAGLELLAHLFNARLEAFSLNVG